MNLSIVVALAGLVIAAVLVVIGVMRVVMAVGLLKVRIDGYASLPILRTYDETLGRVFLAQRAIASVPTLVTRLEDARDALVFARVRLALAASEALEIVRQIPAIVFGLA